MPSERERNKSFWRDDAKLPLFVPDKRRKAAMKYGAILISIPAIVFLAGKEAGLGRAKSAATTLGIELLMLPAFFAYELYCAGGAAGASLNGQIAKLQSVDPAVADQEVNILIDCLTRLSKIAENAKSGFPKVGSNATLEIAQETFLLGMKCDLSDCLGKCSAQLSGKYPATLSTERIASIADFDGLMREIEGLTFKLMRAIDNVGPG